MSDHKITTEEDISLPDDKYLPQEYLRFIRQYSAGEEIKEILKLLNASEKRLSRTSAYDTKPKTAEKWNTEIILEKLATFSSKLLTLSPTDYESTASVKEMKGIEKAYKYVMEDFLQRIDKFLQSAKKLRNELIKTLIEFRMYSRGTALVTLATSITNIALAMGALMQKIFHFSWTPRNHLLYPVVAGISFTTSLLTLSYMSRTTTEISRDLRKESRFLLDLKIAHRKGDWVDDKVTHFFPFGVNLNLMDMKSLETKNYFEHNYSWKKYFCSAIILSNIQKDTKLLKDERFLNRVKLFVENPASEIWWSRMKIKKLLDEVSLKIDTALKEFILGHEQYIYRTATHLYPVLIPYLISSRNSERMRFICSSIAGITAAFDLGNNETQELENLRKIFQTFEKDFKEINKICNALNSSYD